MIAVAAAIVRISGISGNYVMGRRFGFYDAENLDGLARYASDVFTTDAFVEKTIVRWKRKTIVRCKPRHNLRAMVGRAAGVHNVGDAAKIPGEHLNNNIIGDASARAGSIGIRTASFVERALS